MGTKPLTFGSLFAGIGGFDLGFELAGMVCKWQVEKDEFCQKVLAKHWPSVERFNDVKTVGKHNLQPVDVICGGFPCQPHSTAGKRKGKNDDRDLWPEYRRIITELRPTWVIGENVLGIRTTILDEVLSDLEGLAYASQSFVIPACALNAPHRRDRVFIVAYTQHKRRNDRGNGSPGENKIHGRITSEDDRGQGWVQPNTSQNGKVMAYTNGARLEEAGAKQPATRITKRSEQQQSQWAIEPGLGRVAYGVPNRVDRLRSLGNAVVPQVAEFIGRLIVEANNEN